MCVFGLLRSFFNVSLFILNEVQELAMLISLNQVELQCGVGFVSLWKSSSKQLQVHICFHRLRISNSWVRAVLFTHLVSSVYICACLASVRWSFGCYSVLLAMKSSCWVVYLWCFVIYASHCVPTCFEPGFNINPSSLRQYCVNVACTNVHANKWSYAMLFSCFRKRKKGKWAWPRPD